MEDGYGVNEVRLDGCREFGLRQQRDDRRSRLHVNARKIGRSEEPNCICR